MKRRILIVDSDTMMNKINTKVLKAEGLVEELHVTTDGREALDFLKARILANEPMPHLIIFDLDLPIMDGFEFADAFNALDFCQRDSIELVVFTSSSSPKDRQRAAARGIRHYIAKPYLLRNIKDVILRSRLRKPEPAVIAAKGKPSIL